MIARRLMVVLVRAFLYAAGDAAGDAAGRALGKHIKRKLAIPKPKKAKLKKRRKPHRALDKRHA